MSSRKTELKQLVGLACPVALSHLANMSMQLVDTVFVGKLGPEAIGGVSLGNAVFFTLMVGGIGLLLGLDFLVSHAFGRGDRAECRAYWVQSLYLATGVGIPLMLAMYFASGSFARLGVDPSVSVIAAQYLRTLCWSLWPFLLFTASRQYLQAIGVAGPILITLVLANLINALCNWIFIFGHWGFQPMGVAGSGLATGVARTVMFGLILAYVFESEGRARRGNASWDRVPLRVSFEKVARIAKLGAPAAVQIVLEVGVFATATLLAGRLGAKPLAAHQLVLHVASFTFMMPLGLASAAAVRVGQALGAGHRFVAVRTGWTAIALGAGFMTSSGILLYAISSKVIGLFTDDAEVIGLGSNLMLVAALFQISDGVQVVSTGVLRGIGNTKASMYANLFGHWVLGLPVGAALCFGLGWGVQGLWIGLSIGLTVVAGMLLGIWWKRSAVV